MPDADATALESTSIPLSQSQKKRRKKKATKARRDAKAQLSQHLACLFEGGLGSREGLVNHHNITNERQKNNLRQLAHNTGF